MSPEVLAGSSGFIAGLLICSLVLTIRFRAQRQRLMQVREVNEAVITAGVEARQREIDNLNFRLQELQQRLTSREELLQKALVSEASLKTTLTEQQKQNQEKLVLLEQAREQLNMEFKNLANEIFDAKQRSFREQSQAQLDGLLKPLSERIKDFEKRVEQAYSDESKERFSLIREVKSLQELNNRISEDAVNLTKALKGENKTQGIWGEVILERVLERSGLEKGREYEAQVTSRTDEGRRLQPDVIVHLPEGKDVIIDAKVSLVAYERYCSADSDVERAEHLKAHVQSMRQHLRHLGEKDYQKIPSIRTLDFVLLFVPIEAAFSVAIQRDPELFADAFDRNIMVVSPTTLHTTLRMIHNIWRFDQQNKNAQEIAHRAGALYDKFVNFVSDLEDIGLRISSVQSAYEKAHNKLTSGKGNLVSRAQGMRELGARVSKSLPENLVEMPIRDPNRQLLK